MPRKVRLEMLFFMCLQHPSLWIRSRVSRPSSSSRLLLSPQQADCLLLLLRVLRTPRGFLCADFINLGAEMTEAPAGEDDVDEDLDADLRRASKGHLPAPEQQLYSPDSMAAAINGRMHTPDTNCRISVGEGAIAGHLVELAKVVSPEATTARADVLSRGVTYGYLSSQMQYLPARVPVTNVLLLPSKHCEGEGTA